MSLCIAEVNAGWSSIISVSWLSNCELQQVDRIDSSGRLSPCCGVEDSAIPARRDIKGYDLS